MNEDERVRARFIKQVRNEILGILNLMYDIGPFSFTSICESLAHMELPNPEVVKRDLMVLCEKGYALWVNPGNMVPWEKRMFRLTAKGADLVDKIERDPTLEI